MASVYDPPPPASNAASAQSHRFAVTALADPGLLPRALELFAKRALVPSRVTARRDETADGAVLVLAIDCAGLDDHQADHVARVLEATVGVVAVSLDDLDGDTLAA